MLDAKIFWLWLQAEKSEFIANIAEKQNLKINKKRPIDQIQNKN